MSTYELINSFDGFDSILIRIVIFLPIYFGFLYRKIENATIRKYVSTMFGFFIMLIFLDFNIQWCKLFGLNIFIQCIMLKVVGAKHSHLIGIYSILSLSIHKLCLGNLPAFVQIKVEMLIMVYISRICGLSFEIHKSYKHESVEKSNGKHHNDDVITEPGICDILHYVFGYIGLIGGIFYRYRTFDDFIHQRFCNKNHNNFSFLKCSIIAIVCWFYLPFHVKFFDMNYMNSEEYIQLTVWKKYMFSSFAPAGYILFFCIYSYLSEIQARIVGLGAYPTKCKNISGQGPTENYREMKELTTENLMLETYDYSTIQNFHIKVLLMSPWISEYIALWNGTNRYWIANAIRDSMDIENKTMRFILTSFLSVIWHGLNLGHILCVILAAPGIITTSNYKHMFADILKEKTWTAFLYLQFMIGMRSFFANYFMFLYMLRSWDNVMNYLAEIYYLPLVFHALIHIIGNIVYTKIFSKASNKTDTLIEGNSLHEG